MRDNLCVCVCHGADLPSPVARGRVAVAVVGPLYLFTPKWFVRVPLCRLSASPVSSVAAACAVRSSAV